MGEHAIARALYRGALFLIVFIILVLVLHELTVVLMQIFGACIIAAAMAPAVNRLTTSERARRWRWRPPRALAVLGIYLVAGGIAVMIGLAFVRGLLTDLGQLV